MSFELLLTTSFDKAYKKILRKDAQIATKVDKVLHKLIDSPFETSLKTHKVVLSDFGKVYSSWVTGDLRVIWDFRKGKTVIIAIRLGGHSGGNKVYR